MLAALRTVSHCENQPSVFRQSWSRLLGIVCVMTVLFHLTTKETYAQFVIGQTPGTDYLAWEAQDGEITNADDSTGWIWVDNNPDNDASGGPATLALPSGSIALPENTNATRGDALLDQDGGNDQDWVNYKLQFAEPGTYHTYIHYSMFDRTDPTGYGNEDSIYFPRVFGVAPLGPRGENNFWASTPTEGAVFGDGTWEGNYAWWKVESQDPAVDGEGSELKVVTPADVGTVLDFGMAAREPGTSVDKIVMSLNPDLTDEELDALVSFAPNTGDPGDYNADGKVDLADFGIMAENFNLSFPIIDSFAKGDETRDGKVDLRDFLAARQVFNAAPAGAAAIPEPSGALLAFFAALSATALARRRRNWN